MGESSKRLLSMTTPLGPDVLLPVRLQATEAINEPFSVTVDMVSDRKAIAGNELLAKPVCVAIAFDTESSVQTRYLHGLVRAFWATGGAGLDRWGYTAEIVPSLWFLKQTEDCRIWQNKSAIDVVRAVFDDNGISDIEWSVTGTPATRETITQFNESDFDFIMRLLDEEGCFYFFKHSSGGHTLVVADAKTSFQDIPHADEMSGSEKVHSRFIEGWNRLDQTAMGKMTLRDFDPGKPTTPVSGDVSTLLKADGVARRDVFSWPARTLTSSSAKARAKLRIEAAEAFAVMFEGQAAHPLLVPGGKFTRKGEDAGTYAVRSVHHSAIDETFWRTGGAAPVYANRFTAFPATTTWRQPPTVAKPRMIGIHTAIIIGPAGNEIYTDKYGRVQVQFPWDYRNDAMPQQNICWVRVIQPWTGTEGGSNWGWNHMPRVGTEVAVSFMDGDPDRPVVVGCFYNGVAMPVFDLSNTDNWTKSGFRSRSATSVARGGGGNFSEFSFDDKNGSELVFLHAEKDMLTEIENDQTLKVLNCRIVNVTKDETVDIGKAQTITVGNGRAVTVKAKDDTLTVTDGALTVAVNKGAISTTADLGDITTKATAGNIAVKAAAGAITIEAMQSITLKCGPSTLTIDPSGITLKGMTMTIKADLAASVEGGLNASVKGGAMLTLKGAIVMLN